MKRIGLCTLIFACFLCSCNKDESGEKATQKDTGKLQTQALEREGLDVETLDINGDTEPDQWIYKRDGAVRYIQRDFNFDGIIDLTEFYEGSKRVRDEIDLDYDGIVDLIVTYKNEVPVRKEYSVDFEGNRHGVQYFDEKGNRTQIHRDTNGDGKLDTIEYFESGSESPVRVEAIKPKQSAE